MNPPLPDTALAQLFSEARTFPGWMDRKVPDRLLHQLYELAKWGPTSMNSQPMRLVFVKGEVAREKLVATLSPGNVAKVRAAPVTAIVGHDLEFYRHLPVMAPHAKNPKKHFIGKTELVRETAFRNGTLQGAYVILAARSLGLDVGPMSGFDNAALDRAFFPGGTIRSNFIINLGYGDRQQLYPRAPRLSFDQAARIV